jgi:hypothetical protein
MTREEILAAVPDVVIDAWDAGWHIWEYLNNIWLPSTLEQEQ